MNLFEHISVYSIYPSHIQKGVSMNTHCVHPGDLAFAQHQLRVGGEQSDDQNSDTDNLSILYITPFFESRHAVMYRAELHH